ncbi:interferon-inducible GTPase-domain-containing protein [Radiomyces spectabilis]|uniref:interferon-inducible GTPase-domain-containing protein n=1 Tax=Radiomyces spectabilis TaxID=64574 RepID=UPI00221F15C8|nr:interferon-inducible GTPase-domain-containing protein [Radiomyces spectabilis]KAI8365265.1 interferon-inducible GTPase-domain-containing protein [Radiomyces spectabilis]
MMGQAASRTISGKSTVFYDYNDLSNRFTKATLSTLAVPMVIVAFPLLNAYTFTEEELTGVKFMDGAIGGLLGVIGWPLAPFLACWGVFKVLFKDGPPEPLPIPQYIKDRARQEVGLDCENFYNIAVVGVAGTGKSSVVNGIMGYHDTDKYAAATGETESTVKPKGYRHPDLQSMILWDMPGAGTMNHPADTYFEDKFLCAFDSLIIVLAERLQETDLLIAKKAQQWRIPVLFVRNKADQAVDAKMRRYTGKSENRHHVWAVAVGELTKEVRQSIYKQLKANQMSTKRLFIISAWNLQEFVSSLSQRQLKDHLPTIDEERFMRILIEGVLKKRQREQKRRLHEQRSTVAQGSQRPKDHQL